MSKKLELHPTVQAFREKSQPRAAGIDVETLRRLCLECGADDVGFVGIDRAEVAEQRAAILDVFPATQTLVCYCVKMNREPVRSKFRSLANTEFHLASDRVTEIGHEIAARLEAMGIAAMNEPTAFPMESARFPERNPWLISHKLIAEAAGLGKMGLHRNVIHPKFGNFILLGTLMIAAKVAESQPLDYNPCLDCRLCVAACPTGAISEDGYFDFTACYTHNYREFLGGFTDWIALIADAKHGEDYRAKVTDSETTSMWQSLSSGPNYKAAYCLSVCPAGEDIIGPFLSNRKEHVQTVLRPLQEKEEAIYVLQGSDAEAYVKRKYPHKTLRPARSMTRPETLSALFRLMPHVFQRGKAKGLRATMHFDFWGPEAGQKTLIIEDGTLAIAEGHQGQPDVRVRVHSQWWLGISNGQRSVPSAIITGKMKVRGNVGLLKRFAACFPR